MKLECLREKIYNALSLAERVTGKNLTLTILSSVLLEAKGSTLKIRATNLDLGIEIDVPAKIKKEGIVAVPGGVFSSLLSHITSDSVNISLDENRNLVVLSKNTSASIKTYPHDDFPVIPKVEGKNTLTLPIEKLVNGFKSVYYSAALSDIKPEISSVYVHTNDDMIIFAATDSFRLAEKKNISRWSD